MVPKFHKRTIDLRYIAAGIKSSTKRLTKILSGVLSLVDNTIMRMDNYKFKIGLLKIKSSNIYDLS